MGTHARCDRKYSGPVELLERAGVLDQLAAHHAASRAEGRAVLVGGEAGAGKSAVVRAFASSLAPARVARGVCEPLATPRPLAPIAEIAWTLGGDLEALVEQSAPVHHIARALLDELSDGCVVVVEDLHWADAATLDVVRLACRRATQSTGLLIGTYRDDQIGRTDPLRVLLGELCPIDGIHRLHIDPLSEDAVRVLAAGTGLDAHQLYAQTRGNAFFVSEVVGSAGDSIPATVSDAVLARAARLRPSARAVLDALAVLTTPADTGLVERLVGDDLTSIEHCMANGLLVDVDDRPGAVTFRHALARQALEEALPAPVRQRYHAMALAALEEGANDPAVLAHHAAAAGDAAALHRHALAAGLKAVAAGAHTEAVAYLRMSLEHAPALTARAEGDLCGRLAYEAYLLDRSTEAVSSQRRAVGAWARAADPLAHGAALAMLSRMQWLDADTAGAFDSVDAAIAVLEALPPGAELAAAYSQRSALDMLGGDNVGALDWGRRAMALAETVGAVDVQSHALNNIGSAMWCHGDEAGREHLLRSLELAIAIDDLEAVGRAYANLAEMAECRLCPAEAREYLEAGLVYSRARGLTRTRVCLEETVSSLLFAEGAYDEAAASLALLASTPALSRVTQLDVTTRLGLLRVRRGDPGAASAIEQAIGIAEQFAESDRLLAARLADVELAFIDEDFARAREGVEHALARAVADDDTQTDRVAWWARRLGVDSASPKNGRRPYLIALDGDHRGAAVAFRELGWPYEEALALFDAGDAESLRRAAGILAEIGARPLARLVAKRLRAIGEASIPRGPRRSTMANVARLTARELEVLELLSDDRSNRDIADELVVSVRTVEHHVASVLAKLEVTSRRGAVARANGLGLVRSGSPQSR